MTQAEQNRLILARQAQIAPFKEKGKSQTEQKEYRHRLSLFPVLAFVMMAGFILAAPAIFAI